MCTFATRFCLGLLAVCLAASATPASAQGFGSFSVSIQATAVFGGASKQAMLVLPNTPDSNPSFYFDFVIPRGYQTNGEIRVVLYVDSPASPCYAMIKATQLIRSRVSEVPVDDLAGFMQSGVILLAADGRIAGKIYPLTPDGPMADQRPSDGIAPRFARQPNHRSDTCNGPVFVRHIEVRYPLAP